MGSITKFSSMFDEFYDNVYRRWRLDNEKAAKDIVGEEYEKFRKRYYMESGFTFGDNHNVLGSGVNCDLTVMIDNKVVIVEEDKGSYVDSPFLTRAIIDASRIIGTCLQNDLEIPYYILSCPTKMGNFDEIFNSTVELLREDIQSIIKEKFKYLPLCDNGRVNRNIYYRTENNHFELSEERLSEQTTLIDKILNK